MDLNDDFWVLVGFPVPCHGLRRRGGSARAAASPTRSCTGKARAEAQPCVFPDPALSGRSSPRGCNLRGAAKTSILDTRTPKPVEISLQITSKRPTCSSAGSNSQSCLRRQPNSRMAGHASRRAWRKVRRTSRSPFLRLKELQSDPALFQFQVRCKLSRCFSLNTG